MLDVIVLTILEIVVITLAALSEVPLVKKLKETRNKLFLGVILILITIQIASIFQILLYFQITLTIGKALILSELLWLILLTIISLFLLYLKNLKKFYTLPIVVSFFIGFGLVLFDDFTAYIIYTGISGVLGSILLLLDGKKNNNGLVFSMGIALLINVLGAIIVFLFYLEIVGSIIGIVGMVVLVLGSYEIIDKYFLVDKEEEKKIKSSYRKVIGQKVNYLGISNYEFKRFLEDWKARNFSKEE